MSAFTRQKSTRVQVLLSREASRVAEGGAGESSPRFRESVGRSFGRKVRSGIAVVETPELSRLRSPATTVFTTSTNSESIPAEAWTRCAMAMKDHEEARIQAWKEEIDTELVFAALFSAILTAFDVEAYKMLQSQSSNNPTVVVLLDNKFQQVNLGTLAAASSTAAVDPSTPYAVAINALWFSGLICSLAAASISILVRQWLNQYSSGLTSVSPEIARIRQFRQDSLKKWRVAEIMMLLPILLQGAVVLFLVGLVLFLHQLNGTITAIASVLVAVLLFFILLTTVLPTLKDDCSYQSPQAWGFFVIFQAAKRPIRSLCRSISAYATRILGLTSEGYFARLRGRYAKRLIRKLAPFANKPNTYSWVARERILVEASGPALDQHLLVEADATFLEDAFLRETIRPCLNDMPPEAAVKSFYDIMAHRADRIENGVPHFDIRNGRAESVAVFTDLTLDAVARTRGIPALRDSAIRMMRILEPLLIRTLPLTYAHFCRVFFAMSDDPDDKVRNYAFSILYQQVSRNLELADQYSALGCHDLAALVKFLGAARHDPTHGAKHFLDACDLVICLATLPSLAPAPSGPDYLALHADLQGTLNHLRAFFDTPLWRRDPNLLFSLARIASRLVTLERKYPRVLEDAFVDDLGSFVKEARALFDDGNWEDKLRILEVSFAELSALRRGAEQSPIAVSPHESMKVFVGPSTSGS